MVITTSPMKYDRRQPSKGAYDAIVYIEGSEVVAEDANGRKIASGVAGTDDAAVFQAAVDVLDSAGHGELCVGSGIFDIANTIYYSSPLVISGHGTIIKPSANVIFYINDQSRKAGGIAGDRITGITFDGSLTTNTDYICIKREMAHVSITDDCVFLLLKGTALEYTKCWGSNIEGGQMSSVGSNSLIIYKDGFAGVSTYAVIDNVTIERWDDVPDVPFIDNQSASLDVLVNSCYSEGGSPFLNTSINHTGRIFVNGGTYANIYCASFNVGSITIIGANHEFATGGTLVNLIVDYSSASIIGVNGIQSAKLASTSAVGSTLNITDCHIRTYSDCLVNINANNVNLVVSGGSCMIIPSVVTVSGGKWGTTLITGGNVAYCTHTIYDLSNAEVARVVDVVIGTPAFDSNATYDYINAVGVTNLSVSNSTFLSYSTNQPKYVIETGGTAQQVHDNVIGALIPSSLVSDDPKTLWYSNVGYPTDNTGSSTGTGSEQTIAHGLVSAPSRVVIEIPSIGYKGSCTSDATNIKPRVKSGLAFNWHAEV